MERCCAPPCAGRAARAALDRLERGLSELTEAAADELADWELSAMRDPRNWVPTVTAIVVGSAAAGGCASCAPPAAQEASDVGAQALERSMRGVASDVQKRLRR